MPRPDPYSDAAVAQLIARYQAGTSTHELVAEFGGSRRSILRRFRSAGVVMRSAEERQERLPCREDAFACAESDEAAAYWVGVLMADGCISRCKHSTWVILTLAEGDLAHVERFRTFLAAEHKIMMRPPPKRFPHRKVMCDFRVASKRLATDLARYGIVPRKSKTATVHGLERNRHFWRGVVDGDGSLGWYGRTGHPEWSGKPLIQVVGSKSLMRQYAQFVDTVCGEPGSVRWATTCWGVSLSCSRASRMIAHLYTDCSLALPRKWRLAHELLCAWELRRGRQTIKSALRP